MSTIEDLDTDLDEYEDVGSDDSPPRWRRYVLVGLGVALLGAGAAGLGVGLTATSELEDAKDRVEALEAERETDAEEMNQLRSEIVRGLASVRSESAGDSDVREIERRLDGIEADVATAAGRIDCLDQTASVTSRLMNNPNMRMTYGGC